MVPQQRPAAHMPPACLSVAYQVSEVPLAATSRPPAVTAMHVGSQGLAKIGSMQGH